MTTSEFTRDLRAAYHEAAHAVADVLLGARIVSVTIEKGVRRGGCCVNTWPLDDHDLPVKRLVSLFAGFAGQLIIPRSREPVTIHTQSWQGRLDLQQVAEILRNDLGLPWITTSWDFDASTYTVADPFYDGAMLCAKVRELAISVVRQHSAQIHALAMALMEQRTMTGDQVYSVLEKSVASPSQQTA